MNNRFIRRENLLIWPSIIIGAIITANAIVADNKLFLIPLFLLLLLGWIRFATRYPAAALIVIVFLAEDCFDMFTFGLRQRFLSDIGIALMLPIIILNVRRIWEHIARDHAPYALAILLFFCAILVSLYFGSHLKFGQPMAVGLTVARKYLLFLSYFFLVAVGASRKECYHFLKYIAWLGAAIAFLSIVEVALGGGVIFSHYYAIGQQRAGLLRIHVGTFLIVFSVIYSFAKCLYFPHSGKELLGYLLLLGLGLSTLVFVVMTRATILGLIVIFILWLIHKITSKKIMFICATVSLVALIILSQVGNTLLSKTFVGEIVEQTSTELGDNKGNISIREKGSKYFMNLTLENAPLTGIGLFSDTSYPNNPITVAADMYRYYLVDLNGISTLIHFGLQGLILLTFFIFQSIRDTNFAIKHVPSSEKYNFIILFSIFIYTLATPTLNNIIVERMLIYSGVFFYLLSQTTVDKSNITKKS